MVSNSERTSFVTTDSSRLSSLTNQHLDIATSTMLTSFSTSRLTSSSIENITIGILNINASVHKTMSANDNMSFKFSEPSSSESTVPLTPDISKANVLSISQTRMTTKNNAFSSSSLKNLNMIFFSIALILHAIIL
jgi:hypothetical protein